MNRDIIAFTKYKFNVYGKKDIRSGRDSAVVGIVGKSKSLDFPTMLIFWSLVRNSVVLAVYLLFSVACFLTVHEHYEQICTFKKPVLIIHGIEDKLVKIEYSRKANERYENCELIEVHGDHGFILKGFIAGKKATEKYLSDLN